MIECFLFRDKIIDVFIVEVKYFAFFVLPIFEWGNCEIIDLLCTYSFVQNAQIDIDELAGKQIQDFFLC